MLTLSLGRFDWRRPKFRKKGFAWEGRADTSRLALIPGVAFEDYQPPVSLYRDFVGLSCTPDAVLQFANSYGALSYAHRRLPGMEVGLPRDSFARWLEQIRMMKEMVALADAVQVGSLEGMVEALRPLCRREAMYLEPDRVTSEIIGGRATADEIATVATGKLFQSFHGWSPEASWNAEKKSVDARFTFSSLTDFMYSQVSISLIQGRQFQQCKACGRWFQLAPGVGRADKATCSSSCRFTLYRQRRRRALELHEQGWPHKKIAKEVGSEISKVKQWIAESKEQKPQRKTT